MRLRYTPVLIMIAVAMFGMLAMLIALALMQLDRRGERRRSVASQPDTRSAVEKRWATVLALLPTGVVWAMLSNVILGSGKAHALVVLSAGLVALVVLLTYAALARRGALAPARFLRGTWVLATFIAALAVFSGVSEVSR